MESIKTTQREPIVRGAILLLLAISPGLAEPPSPSASDSARSSDFLPPLRGLEEVGWRDMKLRGGFWGPRLDIHRKTTIPHQLDKLEERHHIRNFDVAAKVVAGKSVAKGGADDDGAEQALGGDAANQGNQTAKPESEGEIIGHSAFDSDLHKTLEGACHTLGCTQDPALHGRVEGILDRILAAQQDDGYLVSYYIAKEPENRWGNMRLNHELYNAGHFFEFAVAHHQLDGSAKALDAAKRFADHIDGTFGPGKRYEVCGHQEIELALVKLYRATGEQRYLDLCRFFLEERGHAHGKERKPFTEVIPRGDPEKLPGEEMRDWRRRKWSMRNGRMQDHKPILQQTEAVGHAVRAGYMYAAMADVERFSKEPVYTNTLRKLWEDVVFRKMYITGAVGTAQYGDEGFGDPYLLPNKAYCESCASIAHVFWQHRMNLLTGEAEYADVMELALYNSALSGMSLKGDGYFYQNPLESSKGTERSEWIGLACCPTNLARLTPQVGGMACATEGKRLFVNLYVAGEAAVELDGIGTVRLAQETLYPWDGRIRLTIQTDAPATFDLRLRIPAWARGRPVPGDLYRYDTQDAAAIAVSINKQPIDATADQSGYLSVNRAWNPGDVVEIDFPMPIRQVLAHANLKENEGKVALMKGPVVYCFEGLDNPGVDLFQVKLPPDAKLSAPFRPDLLHGVNVIQTTGLDPQGKSVPLTAVPYFAWANRGECPMNVWMRR